MFRCLALNPEEERECYVYLTEGSMVKNLYKAFGYKNELIAKRFYFFMTDKQPGKKVLFPSYMSFISPLFTQDQEKY